LELGFVRGSIEQLGLNLADFSFDRGISPRYRFMRPIFLMAFKYWSKGFAWI